MPTTAPPAISDEHRTLLKAIKAADQRLLKRFAHKMRVNHDLDRTLVSFQANKKVGNHHRWCKYKEGFSAELITYVLDKAKIKSGRVFDPFAGSGTTLFISSDQGLHSTGIELLPSSAEIIEVRSLIARADQTQLAADIDRFRKAGKWNKRGKTVAFPHLRITAGAFPEETERQLGRYLQEAQAIKDELLGRVLRFAALCILEEVSYTRKDGQYLRWDQRSGRCLGKKLFDKGRIWTFDEAITRKLDEIIGDLTGKENDQLLLDLGPKETVAPGVIDLLAGSCLEIMPTIKAKSFNALITSPPYCNRYDYTRTYALELAMLGVDQERITSLRQTMLSCTVENKEKMGLEQIFNGKRYQAAQKAFDSQEVLSLALDYLEVCRQDGTINNPGIPRMVRNYFWEMTLLIFESARLLKPGAPFVMVNDNVRYQGAHIPVDLILSDMAERAGFEVEAIWILPRGKGNSSQQMGLHGREEIRKCIYVWRLKSSKPVR